MSGLNYHHLHLFWVVAREESVSRAAKILHLTQPTISAQLRLLQAELGQVLFTRTGRGIALTDAGRVVQRYAEEIFTLGRELNDTLEGLPTGRPARFRVGVADGLPKLLVYRLLEPLLTLAEPVQLVVSEGAPPRLLAQLAEHELDVALLDHPAEASLQVRTFSHLLGETDVTLCAAPGLAARTRRGFPGSLDGAPMLLPAEGTVLRRQLERWCAQAGVRPRVVGEFADSAVLKLFGGMGAGVFALPTALLDDARQQYGIRPVGRIPSIKERFYAATAERRIAHPALRVLSDVARRALFG